MIRLKPFRLSDRRKGAGPREPGRQARSSSKAIPKKRTRERIRIYENGIKTFADGRELCMTPEAWEKRKDELYERSGGICEMEYWGMRCGSEAGGSEMHAHHIRKRSLRGGDQLSNLQASCPECHINHHLRGEGQ